MKKKPVKKKKLKVSDVKKKAWVVFSKYIRLRDHGVCITCGKTFDINKCQAGHYISRRHNSVLFDEQNVHCQCLTEESKIRMHNGSYKSIKDVKQGDNIWAFDEHSYSICCSVVESTNSFVPKELYEVELEDGNKFYATKDHRIISNGGWIEIQDVLHSIETHDIMEPYKEKGDYNMLAIFEKTKHTKYFVNRKGEIFSSTTYNSDGILRKKKPTLNKNRGYIYVRTKTKNYKLHRLVASAFVDNPNNKNIVNHKNGNKLDNRACNLEWVTHKENINHAIKKGLTILLKKNEGNIKYSNEQCKNVLKRIKSGMTYIKAGEIYSMPYSTVAHLVRGSRREL